MTRSNPGPTPVAQGAVASGRGLSAASGPQRLVIEDFPEPDVARDLSPNGRVHWHRRHAQNAHVGLCVAVAINQQKVQPMRGRFVTMQATFVYPVKRKRDDDNLATGVLKAVRDSLIRGRMIDADDIDHLRQLPVEIRIEKGRRALILAFTSEPLP